MGYQQLADWVHFNKLQIGIIAFFIIYLSYTYLQKVKKKRVASEDTKKINPIENIDIDLLDIDTKFAGIETAPGTNIEFLQDLKEKTRNEITSLQGQYEKAKKEFMYILSLEKKLKWHIEILIKQERMYDEQINKLTKRGI